MTCPTSNQHAVGAGWSPCSDLARRPAIPTEDASGPAESTAQTPPSGTRERITAWNRAANLAMTGPNKRQHQGEARVLVHQILGRGR